MKSMKKGGPKKAMKAMKVAVAKKVNTTMKSMKKGGTKKAMPDDAAKKKHNEDYWNDDDYWNSPQSLRMGVLNSAYITISLTKGDIYKDAHKETPQSLLVKDVLKISKHTTDGEMDLRNLGGYIHWAQVAQVSTSVA